MSDAETDTDTSRDDKAAEKKFCKVKRDVKIAGGAGVAAASVISLASLAVGNINSWEAKTLVEAIIPTSRYLCTAIMSATSTTLALMLTMVGLTSQSSLNLAEIFYKRIKRIALYDMSILVGTTVFLTMHCIPIAKSDGIPNWWYTAVYYGLLGVSAVLGGSLVSIVVMLYMAIRDVINAVGLGKGEHLVKESSE